jgi:glutamate-5-semialdehyde dehydrogenase
MPFLAPAGRRLFGLAHPRLHVADSARGKAEAARAAALRLQRSSDAERRAALEAYARLLEARAAEVESANASDLAAARELAKQGQIKAVLLDRLAFKGPKLAQAIAGVRAVAALPDPLGRTLRATLLDEGLELRQVRVPIGVVACAFESRPDAVVQVGALAMRTGNALLLKGGREAAHSNALLAALAREALAKAGLPEDGVQLLQDREELHALLACDGLVDLVVPRGSSEFVRFVQDHTRIPVLGHAEGVCHTYVDASADLDAALRVCLDAKLDYPAACNATECFLVHRDVACAFVPTLARALAERGVEVRADAEARALAPQAKPAQDADWGHEFGDLACALRIVGSTEEAVAFINRHGSKHTEAILARDAQAQQRFVEGVDAAGVFVNASTRFADGYRYGLGAEVGVSTGKVHARGPVGLEGLTTTKWILRGQGHVAGDYQGAQAKPFKHEPLER